VKAEWESESDLDKILRLATDGENNRTRGNVPQGIREKVESRFSEVAA